MFYKNKNLPQVVIAGEFQNGKSTLVNCLLDDKYAPTGNGLRTTKCCTFFHYGEAEIAKLIIQNGKELTLDRLEDIFSQTYNYPTGSHFEISCWKPLLQQVNLIDTPGFGVYLKDDQCAMEAIEKSDIVLYLHASTALSQDGIEKLNLFRERGKKIFFLFNCKDESKWDPESTKNLEICKTIEAQLSSMGILDTIIPINGKKVCPCNPLWAWYALGHLQRDLDSPQTYTREETKEKLESINFFCKKRNISKENCKQELLRKSSILDVRRSIENIVAILNGNMLSNPNKEIKHLTGKWLTQIRNMVDSYKR